MLKTIIFFLKVSVIVKVIFKVIHFIIITPNTFAVPLLQILIACHLLICDSQTLVQDRILFFVNLTLSQNVMKMVGVSVFEHSNVRELKFNK